MSYAPSPPPMPGPPPGPPGPPGPPPPGWGPPQQPQKSSKGSAGIWIFLGLVVVVGIGAFLVLGNDEDSSGGGGGGAADNPSSPEAAVEAYFAALEATDCTTLVDLQSEATTTAGGETRESAVAACEAEVASGSAELPTVTLEDLEVTAQEGDTATVSVTASADGDTETSDFLLVNEGGEWKIDLYNMGSSASAEAPPDADGS